MSDEVESYLTCPCPHCGGLIEFPAAWAGAGVECPHCGEAVNLVEAEPVGASPGEAAGTHEGALTASQIATAFQGGPVPRRRGLGYRAALVLAMAATLLLPASYVALVAGVWVATGCFAWRWFAWADRFTGGSHLMPLKALMYVVGLVAGVVVGVFLVKPLFVRRSSRVAGLGLSPSAEPLLFAFLNMVADAVGAPRPARVEVNCRVNAAAGLRGGELVLTLGLPLVGVLSLRELAGVVAHEFAHFDQGLGLRASRLIRSVNAWLYQVAYGRDDWDEAVDRSVEEASSARGHLLLGVARAGLWVSRSVLKVQVRLGRAVGQVLLREMERDADRCQVELAGSEAFEDTFRRLHLLRVVARDCHRGMRAAWESERRLPDDLPQTLVRAEAAVAPEARERRWERQLGRGGEDFEAHPADADRLERARQAAAPGRFTLEGPAPALFANFPELSRQATVLHYEETLRIPRDQIRFTPGPA